jgi:TonB family protein
MTSLLIVVKMFICSLVLLAYYWIFLRNKKFHHYNRFFLLSTAAVSIVFPFLNIHFLVPAPSEDVPVFVQALQTISVNGWETDAGMGSTGKFYLSTILSLKNVALSLYVFVMLPLFIRLAKSLRYIHNIRRRYEAEQIGDLKLYDTNEAGTPFSFFKSIFWNRTISIESQQGQQIFRHELFHVRQGHSVDIILMEILCVIAWFNPVFHLIKKELRAIHEFLADQYAASENDRYAYAELLVMESIRNKQSTMGNSFFQSHIKRRIAMITQLSQSKYGYWSRIMALPLSCILFCFVSLRAQRPVNEADASVPNVLKNSIHQLPIPGDIKKHLVKCLLRNLRYPEQSRMKGEETTVYFSIDINTQGKPDNLKIYETAPDLANQNWEEIAVVAKQYPVNTKTNIQKEEEEENDFKTAIKNVIKQYREPAQPSSEEEIMPQTFYFKIRFSIEKSNAAGNMSSQKEDTVRVSADELEILFAEFSAPDMSFNSRSDGKHYYIKFNKDHRVFLISKNEFAKLSAKSKDNSQDAAIVFNQVEIEAQYPGGTAALFKYLQRNLKYPELAKQQNIHGDVMVEFIVDKEGNLANFRRVSGDSILGVEAIRVISSSGRWKPAIQNGKKVKSIVRQKVVFKRANEENKNDPEHSKNNDQPPSYPGGQIGWINYVAKNIRYPE